MDSWLARSRFTVPLRLDGIPERFATAELAALPNTTVKDVVIEYLKGFWEAAPLGIAPLFLGPARTFKTHAAAVIVRLAHLNAGVTAEFVSCPTQLVDLDLHRYSENTRKTVRRWQEVPLLVLDDFGVIERGSFKESVLTSVTAARFDALRPTIWTANLDLAVGREFEAIASLYSPLLARRLEDGSRGFRAFTS